LLRALRVPVPAELRAIGQVPEKWGTVARLALLEWIVGTAEIPDAARALAESCGPQAAPRIDTLAVADRLAELAREVGAERVTAVVRAAQLPDFNAHMLLVLAGVADATERARMPDLQFGHTPRGAGDLAYHALLAVEPGGRDAREKLFEALRDPERREPAIAALERAVDALRARRDELRLRELVSAVRKLVRDADPALRARLRVDQWPPAPRVPALDLDREDRALEAAGW
jgi:hypothetical protein